MNTCPTPKVGVGKRGDINWDYLEVYLPCAGGLFKINKWTSPLNSGGIA